MNNIYLLKEEVKSIQIDHNSTCNLKCPQCATTLKGNTIPNLPMKTLSLDFYKEIFDKNLCKQLDNITFCGNYGDVIASDNILEVCNYLRSNGLKKISIFTNGSLIDENWWRELSKILDRPNDRVCFSIDGLEETNHLFRIGSNFNKIMSNINAFIGAGGKARWDYLVFEHDEHEVEKARSLTEEMGFVNFNLNKTNRFLKNNNYKTGKITTTTQVFKKEELLHHINRPKREEYQKDEINQIEKIIAKYGSWNNYIQKTPISCKTRNRKSIFVDFEGRVWPCCWVGAPYLFNNNENIQKDQLLKLIENYGENFNCLYKSSLNEILNHDWFKEQLVKSWNTDKESEQEKLVTCGRTCGGEYEFSSDAERNKQSVEFKRPLNEWS